MISHFIQVKPLFCTRRPSNKAYQQACIEQIWWPYHQQLTQELARIKQKFGYAILFDAHSVKAQVPMFFEGTLPDFNLGTNDGASCAPKHSHAAQKSRLNSSYSQVSNGRFKGGAYHP